MSMCRVFSCVVGRGCLLWPEHSLGKTLLVFALLHSVLQGQICLLLQVFLDFLLWLLKPGKKGRYESIEFCLLHNSLCVCIQSQSCPALCDPVDCSPPVPFSVEFSRQEYWSRLPFPSPGDLPNSGIDTSSLASPALAGGFSTTSTTWEALISAYIR